MSSLLITIAIIVSLLGDSITFLTNIDLGELWTTPHRWAPRVGHFDLLTLFMGSLLVTAVAMVIAIPLGLAAAAYLAEYANPRVRRVLKPILEVLAGIPSIVLAFFAIEWIGPEHRRAALRPTRRRSASRRRASASASSSPRLVASVSEDAMRAVPHALREASYGMGAREDHDRDPGRVPGGDLRHRRRGDPRRFPCHR